MGDPEPTPTIPAEAYLDTEVWATEIGPAGDLEAPIAHFHRWWASRHGGEEGE